jgi:hypothetical protein
MKLKEALWFKLLLVLLGGLLILAGVVMVNTSYKILSGAMIILGAASFFYGLHLLD